MARKAGKSVGVGTRLKRALGRADEATPFLGGAIHELVPGLVDSQAGVALPSVRTQRLSSFEKAIMLEQAEKRVRCRRGEKEEGS